MPILLYTQCLLHLNATEIYVGMENYGRTIILSRIKIDLGIALVGEVAEIAAGVVLKNPKGMSGGRQGGV
jgi:hypothetical protein